MLCCAAPSQSQDLDPSRWTHLKGYWKFQDQKAITAPTVGNALTLVGAHQVVSGPAVGDTAIRIAVGSYYKCQHLIPPNGGGDSVNQYTLMYDFKILSLQKWHTFHQTDTSNKNDGECFIRPITETNPGRIGTATTKYTQDSVIPNQWYRLMISVNLGHFYRYYLNGKLILEGDTQNVDGRFALLPELLFFADNNAEDDTIDIASIAIFDTCLSTNEIAKIGTIDPCIANPTQLNLGNDTNLCWNQSLNLSAGIGHKSYLWSNGKKLPFTSFSANGLGLGFHEVWVNITDQNGCSVSDTLKIQVSALPNVNLGRDTSLCGSELVLKGGTDSTEHYAWLKSPSNTLVGNGTTCRIVESGIYELIVTDSKGCAASDNIQVTLNPIPTKPAITSTSKRKFCSGDSILLETIPGYNSYVWNGVKTNSHQWAQWSSDSIAVIVIDSNDCESEASDKIGVEMVALPDTPSIKINDVTSVFCEGDSIEISTVPGYDRYFWQDGEGQKNRWVRTEGNFRVRVLDTNGCSSAWSFPMPLKPFPIPSKPEMEIVGNPTFCEGEPIGIRCTKTGYSYRWSSGNNGIIDTLYTDANCAVQITDSNGCRNVSDTLLLDFDEKPAKPLVYRSNGDTLMTTDLAEKYQWYLDGFLLPNDSLNYVIAKKSGTYNAVAVNGKCHSELSVGFNHIQAGVFEEIRAGFRMYPNPAGAYFRVEFYESQPRTLSITDVRGELIRQWESNDSVFTIQTTELGISAGYYFITVESSKQVFRKTLMIQP